MEKALFEAWEQQIAEMEGLGTAFPPTGVNSRKIQFKAYCPK